MNLTDNDKQELINQLSSTLTVNKKKKPKAKSYEEIFGDDFEKWAVKNKILFPPKTDRI